MAAIPWGPILTTLPSLLDAAGRLFKKADDPRKSLPAIPIHDNREQLEAVIKRLEYFESLESEQAKLLQQTIEQLQNVALSSSAMAKRANISLGLACMSLLVALVAIIR